MLTLIENNALDSYRTDSMTRLTRLGRQEELIEYGLMTTFSGIIQQCSSEIFDVRSITCCVTSLRVYNVCVYECRSCCGDCATS